MTKAKQIEMIIKAVVGEDFDLKAAMGSGAPFQRCFGFKCPDDLVTIGYDGESYCDCKKCKYRRIWEKEDRTWQEKGQRRK